MSQKDQTADDVNINLGGKTVPFSKINKPHTVVIKPQHHHPQTKDFPDLEPQAKQREAELEQQRGYSSFIQPSQHQPLVNAKDFPDLEPSAKAKEADLERKNT